MPKLAGKCPVTDRYYEHRVYCVFTGVVTGVMTAIGGHNCRMNGPN